MRLSIWRQQPDHPFKWLHCHPVVIYGICNSVPRYPRANSQISFKNMCTICLHLKFNMISRLYWNILKFKTTTKDIKWMFESTGEMQQWPTESIKSLFCFFSLPHNWIHEPLLERLLLVLSAAVVDSFENVQKTTVLLWFAPTSQFLDQSSGCAFAVVSDASESPSFPDEKHKQIILL